MSEHNTETERTEQETVTREAETVQPHEPVVTETTETTVEETVQPVEPVVTETTTKTTVEQRAA